ncbi:MAG: hypothetical protein L0Y71_09630 [Gemmataceae bacterium]|nr:hypothetical protein [Gemmataceae bacterium]
MNRCFLARLVQVALPFAIVGVALLLARTTARGQLGEPTVSIMSTGIMAGEGAAVNVGVMLTPAANQPVTVHYATANGSATAPADYTHTEGDLSWPAGSMEMKTISVPIANDGVPDGGEKFTITLTNCQGAVLGASTCEVTINDMGGGPPMMPTVRFSSDTYSKSEAGGSVTITVELSEEPTQTVTVQYATSDGMPPSGASAGSDYQSASGTLTFAPAQGGQPGETSKTFTVTILQCKMGAAQAGLVVVDWHRDVRQWNVELVRERPRPCQSCGSRLDESARMDTQQHRTKVGGRRMNPHPLGLLLALHLSSLCLGGQDPGGVTEPKVVRDKTRQQGVELIASMRAETIAGSHLLLRLELDNQGTKDMGYVRYFPKYRDVVLAVHDSTGKAVPLTRFGKFVYGAGRGEGSAATPRLKPGKSHIMNLNLARVFDLTIPGEYTLTVRWYVSSRQVDTEGVDLRIEKLRFRIVDEPE